MEKLKQLLAEANTLMNRADHLTYITYPVVNEIKLLYTVVENLSKSVSTGMDAVLYYDRLYKRIMRPQGSFQDELDLFSRHSMPRYNIDRKHVLLIRDLKSFVEAKKKSPMEFVRRDKFVICSDTYKMKVLNIKKVKEYLAQSKEFISQVNRTIRC
ncbi:MAG: hypothetical protein ABIB71_02855 [Candidatus Woesearchaeota archaeon]